MTIDLRKFKIQIDPIRDPKHSYHNSHTPGHQAGLGDNPGEDIDWTNDKPDDPSTPDPTPGIETDLPEFDGRNSTRLAERGLAKTMPAIIGAFDFFPLFNDASEQNEIFEFFLMQLQLKITSVMIASKLLKNNDMLTAENSEILGAIYADNVTQSRQILRQLVNLHNGFERFRDSIDIKNRAGNIWSIDAGLSGGHSFQLFKDLDVIYGALGEGIPDDYNFISPDTLKSYWTDYMWMPEELYLNLSNTSLFVEIAREMKWNILQGGPNLTSTSSPGNHRRSNVGNWSGGEAFATYADYEVEAGSSMASEDTYSLDGHDDQSEAIPGTIIRCCQLQFPDLVQAALASMNWGLPGHNTSFFPSDEIGGSGPNVFGPYPRMSFSILNKASGGNQTEVSNSRLISILMFTLFNESILSSKSSSQSSALMNLAKGINPDISLTPTYTNNFVGISTTMGDFSGYDASRTHYGDAAGSRALSLANFLGQTVGAEYTEDAGILNDVALEDEGARYTLGGLATRLTEVSTDSPTTQILLPFETNASLSVVATGLAGNYTTSTFYTEFPPESDPDAPEGEPGISTQSTRPTRRSIITGEEYAYLDLDEGSGLDHYQAAHDEYTSRVDDFTNMLRALYTPQRSHESFASSVSGDQTRPYAILGTIAELFYFWLKDFEERSDYEGEWDNQFSAYSTAYDYPRWNFYHEGTGNSDSMGPGDFTTEWDTSSADNRLNQWFRTVDGTSQMMRNSASGAFELCILAHAWKDEFVLNALIEWVVSKYKIDRHFGGSGGSPKPVNLRSDNWTAANVQYPRGDRLEALAAIDVGWTGSLKGRRYHTMTDAGTHLDTAPEEWISEDYISANTNYNLASMKLAAMIIRLIGDTAGEKVGGSTAGIQKRWTNTIRNYVEMNGTCSDGVDGTLSYTRDMFAQTLADIHDRDDGGAFGHYIGFAFYTHVSDYSGIIESGEYGSTYYPYHHDYAGGMDPGGGQTIGILHSPNWHPLSNPLMWYLEETFDSPDNIDPQENYWQFEEAALEAYGVGTAPSGDDIWNFTRSAPTLGSLARICLFLGRLGFTNTVTNLDSENLPGAAGGEGMQLSLRTHDGGGDTASANLHTYTGTDYAHESYEFKNISATTWLTKANGIFDEQYVALGVILLVRCWGLLFDDGGSNNAVEMGFWISDSDADYGTSDLGAWGKSPYELGSEILYEWPDFGRMYGTPYSDGTPTVSSYLGELIDDGAYAGSTPTGASFYESLLPYTDIIGLNEHGGAEDLLAQNTLVYIDGFEHATDVGTDPRTQSVSAATRAPYSSPGAGGIFNFINNDGPRALKMSMWWEDESNLSSLKQGLKKLTGKDTESSYQPDSEGGSSSRYDPGASGIPTTTSRAYKLLSCWLNAMEPYKNIFLSTKFFNALGIRIQNALDSVADIISSDGMINLIFAEDIEPGVRGENLDMPVHLVDNLTLESLLSSFNSFAPYTQQFYGWGSGTDESSKNITFPAAYVTSPTDLTNFTALMKQPLFRGKTSETGIPVGEKQRILVVGLPIGFMDYMRSLAEACLGTSVLNATSLIKIKINKVDMKNDSPGTTGYHPKEFLFDTRLFIKTAEIPDDIFTRSFVWDNDNRKITDWVKSDDSDVDFDKDFVADILDGGAVRFNFMDIPAYGSIGSMVATKTYTYSDFSGATYSNQAYGGAVSTDESIEIAVNHANDYYLKYYLNLAMGIDVSEMGFFFNEAQVSLVQPGSNLHGSDGHYAHYEFSPGRAGSFEPTFLEPAGGYDYPTVGASEISKQIIEVGDNLDAALRAATTDHPFDPSAEGIDPIDPAIIERIQKMTAKASQFSSDYLKERITLPKMFERTFALIIDVDDFEMIDSSAAPPPSTGAEFYAFSASVEIFKIDSSPFSEYDTGAYDALVTALE